MNHFRYSLKEPAISYIINGSKKVEGRLFKNTFKNISIGDKITFYNNNKTVDVKVTKLGKYNDFGQMLISTGIKNTTPKAKSFNEAISLYNTLYSKDDIKNHGVLAIHIDNFS